MATTTRKARGKPRRNPEALAQFKLGRSLAASGRTEEAAGCYRRALELDPEFAEAVVNLGILYGQMGPRFAEEHLSCLTRGVELNPDSARAHYNLGVALARRRPGSDAAIAEFERALALEAGHRNALYALAAQWSKRGDRTRAEEYHRRYRAAMGQAEPVLGRDEGHQLPSPVPVAAQVPAPVPAPVAAPVPAPVPAPAPAATAAGPTREDTPLPVPVAAPPRAALAVVSEAAAAPRDRSAARARPRPARLRIRFVR